MDGNTVDPVEKFTYLGSIQSSKSNSRPEYIRRIGLAASALKRLDCVWSHSKLSITTKLCIYSTCVLPILLYGSETWIHSTYGANDASCTSDGTTSYLTMKSSLVLHRTGLFDVSYIVRKRRLGLFGAVWARRQTSTPCTSKPDPTNLHQVEGW